MHTEFDIPDLPSATKGLLFQYWAKVLFVQWPSERYRVNALTSNYVRLVEAAIIEYQSGASEFREAWTKRDSFHLSGFHRSASHFESCISNMCRATNCFIRLRRDRGRNPLSIELNREKASFATEPVFSRIRSIRNGIHHLDKMVLKGEVSEGQSFALQTTGPEVSHPTERNQTIKTFDRLQIGSNEVRFSELAEWLTEMHSFAVKIAECLPNSPRLPVRLSG